MKALLSFVILMIFWLLWSGLYDPFHVSLGVISCLIVTFWSQDLLISKPKLGVAERLAQFFRFIWYCVWLTYQIVLANLDVLKVALHPRLESVLDPQMISFKSGFKSDIGQYNLAHSITLTPGTVTVEIDKGTFLVHALTQEAADAVPGEMVTRINRVFGGKA